MKNCPNNSNGEHRFTYSVGSGVRSDFEPVQYGQTIEDTLYKRIEYSVLACSCGMVRKQRVAYEEDV